MRFSGRHVAPFRGFEPTGKTVHWLGAALFRFENGVIADLWVLGDLAGLDTILKRNQGAARDVIVPWTTTIFQAVSGLRLYG